MNNKVFRLICRLLIVTVALISFPIQPASAAMIGTEAAIAEATGGHERARVESFLSRGDVQAQMQKLGIDARDAKARVSALTDEEVRLLSGKLDKLPAGGLDALGVILLVFVILLITDILGLTKIFPFTRSML